MRIGWMYILECADDSYYTGSTNNLERRIAQHQAGEGANHTKKRLPVKLVYYEEFSRIDEAFKREKQVQRWSRKKKEALINGEYGKLPDLSIAYRDRAVVSRTPEMVLKTPKVVSRASTTKEYRSTETLPLPEMGSKTPEMVLRTPEVVSRASTTKEYRSPEALPLPEALEGNTKR